MERSYDRQVRSATAQSCLDDVKLASRDPPEAVSSHGSLDEILPLLLAELKDLENTIQKQSLFLENLAGRLDFEARRIQRQYQTMAAQLSTLQEYWPAISTGKETASCSASAGDTCESMAATQQNNRLEIHTLGSLSVRSLTRKIQAWQSNRAKTVFEYLVNRPTTPISREILMEALWPDYDAKAAANNLKTAIHDLRQILAPLFPSPDCSGILFSHDCYCINPEIKLWIDAEEFEGLWKQGRRLEKDGRIADATQALEKAEALYKGDYLEDEAYEEWGVARREALKDTYLLVLNKLADWSMNSSDYEGCISYCHKILARDNCREDIYRVMMCCYSRLGQQNNALRWYANCRRILKSELDVQPLEETVSLYDRLKRGETI